MLILLTWVIVTGCSTLATGGAEISGLSLLHDRRTSKAIMTDERIEINAGMELNAHNDIRDLCHVNVTAYNGIALITGEAPTYALRKKIVGIIQVIAGVKLVHNQLVVAKPSSFASRSGDALITTKIKSSLSKVVSLPGFDATRVKVVTENGTVFLMGLVHQNEGNVTAEIARRASGVKKVIKVFEYIK